MQVLARANHRLGRSRFAAITSSLVISASQLLAVSRHQGLAIVCLAGFLLATHLIADRRRPPS